MTTLSKRRAVSVCGAVTLAVASFCLGRHSAQNALLQQIASDPNVAEAAKAINAIDAFRAQLASGGQQAEARHTAAADAEAKKRAEATDTIQNADVRIHVDKVYRGKLLQEVDALSRLQNNGDDHQSPTDSDYLVVVYKVENLTKSALLEANVLMYGVDSFGNEIEEDWHQEYDSNDLLRRLNLDATKVSQEKIGPGESTYGYAVYKKPLHNASWYIVKLAVAKANGEQSDPLYLKVANNHTEAVTAADQR